MYGILLTKQTRNLKSSKFIVISILHYQVMFLLFFLHMQISKFFSGSPQKSILSSLLLNSKSSCNIFSDSGAKNLNEVAHDKRQFSFS